MSLSDFANLLKSIENGLNSIARAKANAGADSYDGDEEALDTTQRYHCYRNICSGMMEFDYAASQFVCRDCGAKAWPDELRDNDLGLIDLNVGDTYNGVKGFSFAYDPDGSHFKCPVCGGNVMNDDANDRQICSICGHVITEAEFNDMLRDWDIRTGGDGNF